MEKYLSPEQVCGLVPGMTKGALAQLRFTGRGPRFYKPTPKTVLYTERECLEWVEDSARMQTGQAVA